MHVRAPPRDVAQRRRLELPHVGRVGRRELSALVALRAALGDLRLRPARIDGPHRDARVVEVAVGERRPARRHDVALGATGSTLEEREPAPRGRVERRRVARSVAIVGRPRRTDRFDVGRDRIGEPGGRDGADAVGRGERLGVSPVGLDAPRDRADAAPSDVGQRAPAHEGARRFRARRRGGRGLVCVAARRRRGAVGALRLTIAVFRRGRRRLRRDGRIGGSPIRRRRRVLRGRGRGERVGPALGRGRRGAVPARRTGRSA